MSFNTNRHIWTLTKLLGLSGTSLGWLRRPPYPPPPPITITTLTRIQPPELDRLRSL